MTVLEIVPARYVHIAPIAIHMREADRVEAKALANESPFGALEMCFKFSADKWTVMFDGVPAAMFGAGAVADGIVSVWMLGTDELEHNKAAVARGSVFWRDQLLARYGTLANIVDARNTVTIRWLRWLGFAMSEPFEAGPNMCLVRKFELRRKVLLCA